MAFAARDFVPGVDDDLTRRTLPTFFGAIQFVLEAGVTTVAEAAFQHHVWHPRLDALSDLAKVVVVRCRTDAAIARERVRERASLRSVHADSSVLDNTRYYDEFRWLEFEVPSIDVDTTVGYRPPIPDVADWISANTP